MDHVHIIAFLEVIKLSKIFHPVQSQMDEVMQKHEFENLNSSVYKRIFRTHDQTFVTTPLLFNAFLKLIFLREN